MDFLFDGDATGYCVGSPAHRATLWEAARTSAECPAFVLSVFEICHAIYSGTRSGRRLDIGRFRTCWEDLVQAHEEESASKGARVRLLESGGFESRNVPFEVWSRSRVIPDGAPRERAARGDERDREVFREAFRAIDKAAFDAVAEEEDWRRQWDHPVRGLPGGDWLPSPAQPQNVSPHLVLDTNFFVDLLEELPADGRIGQLPCQNGRPADKLRRERRRFQDIIDLRGVPGRLVIPVAVLVETYGIVRVKGERTSRYRNADRVMQALALQGDEWPLWNVFRFEPLSLDVLDAFLGLHEALVQNEPDRNLWPDFTDALILAHGLLHHCPVISGEWIDKNDWAAVRRLFPYLVP